MYERRVDAHAHIHPRSHHRLDLHAHRCIGVEMLLARREQTRQVVAIVASVGGGIDTIVTAVTAVGSGIDSAL